MIEFKTTSLDEKFMILWSNYMLSKKIDVEELEELAKQGQLNAIQNFYLLLGKKNAQIDAIVDEMDSRQGPDAYYTKLCKLYSENREEIEKLYSENIEKRDALYRERYEAYQQFSCEAFDLFKFDGRDKLDKIDEKLEDARKELLAMPFYGQRSECACDYFDLGVKTNNPKYIQTALELMTAEDYRKLTFEVALDIRKKLKKLYKRNPSDLSTKFCLAKNCYSFGRKDKDFELGAILFNEISSMESCGKKPTQE